MVGLTESVTIAIALPALLRVQAEVGRLLVAVQLGLAWHRVGREWSRWRDQELNRPYHEGRHFEASLPVNYGE